MALKDYSLQPKAPKPDIAAMLNDLSDAELIKLRSAVDKRLNIDPRSLNLADELSFQYKAGKTLLASIQDDANVPANQRSQVLNSCTTMLEKITKQMDVVFSAERLKRYEAAWMKVMEDLPEESKRKFFDLYSEYLKQT